MPSSISSESDGTQNPTNQLTTPATSPSLMDEPLQGVASDAVIVGMACRLPGAKSPEQLWKNIIQQKDLQRKIPADRFNIEAYYHPDGTHKGTVCISHFQLSSRMAMCH